MIKKRAYIKNEVSGDIINDRFNNLEYTPLSRNEEISLIRKAKLSFYDDVNEDQQELYLNYYFEEFPEFKAQYEISSDKETLLEDAIINSKEYRDYFLDNNRRLVYLFVKKLNVARRDFEDLFQEGVIGMMTALKKFDVESGHKFSTYAIWWIRQAIIRNMRYYSKAVKIPENLSEKIYIYDKTKEALEIKLGREPSSEEIAEKMNEDNIEKVELAKYRSYIRSLDEPVGMEESSSLGDLIIDKEDNIEQIDNQVAFSVLSDVLESLDLNDREKIIINMRFGLKGFEIHTVNEIADKFNLSGARIRQLESKVLRKLRLNKKIIQLSKDLIPNNEKIKTFKIHNRLL